MATGKTFYIAIEEGNTREVATKNLLTMTWKPWINCVDDVETLAMMALNKHMRDRGGIHNEKLEIFVFLRTSLDMQIEAGRTAKVYQFSVRPPLNDDMKRAIL